MGNNDNASPAQAAITLPAGHRAVVIGGGGTIGAACIQALASAGATVWSVDLGEDAAARASAGLGNGHKSIACDVTDPLAVDRLAQTIGPVDSVVYAAGLNHDGEILDMDWALYRKVMAVNLDGAFHVSSSFARSMIAADRSGAFVFLSSTAGLRGEAGASVYCATKFGLIGLTECVAAELSRHRIRANVIGPGNVDSPMLKDVAAKIAGRTGEEAEAIWESMAHAGAATRLVDPDEVAKLCVYLASPLSSGITGTTVRVDAGGMLSV
jgi:NAD(P)-dependent dehydrogenase (short-subunit alcohol dehydrogenase family)